MRLKSFEILNYTVPVYYHQEIIDPEEGGKLFGRCNPQSSYILVATHSPFDGEPLSEDVIKHNLCHEIAHFVLFFTPEKYRKLYNDEDFVDLLGALTAQVLKTAKYE